MSKEEKQQHIHNFIKAFVSYEEEMEPFKEGKRDLRKSYADKNWLTRDEMALAVKAYRILQKQEDGDLSNITDIFEMVENLHG